MNITYDLTSENALLGMMLLEHKYAIEGILNLKEEDFGDENNRLIFSGLKKLSEKGEPLEVHSLCSILRKDGVYEKIGGINKLLELSNSVDNFNSEEFYVQNIKQYSLLRKLLGAVNNVSKDFETKKIEDINSFVAEAEKSLIDVTRTREIKGFSTSKEIITKIGSEFELNRSGNVVQSEILTGFSNIDKLTGGYKKGNLIIIAARPSVGKTAFAMSLCLQNASTYHKPVAVFSLEMTKEDLMKRALASVSHISYEKISKVDFTNEEYQKIRSSEKILSELPLFIDDNGGNSIDDIVSKCRKLKQDQGEVGLVMIDYIGLIVPSKKKANNRQEEVSEISRRLKELSKEIECPVICLSQLSRQCEMRDDKRPMLSDLRESGSIEQDADQVYLMYRGDYYKNKATIDDKKTNICISEDVKQEDYSSVSIVELNVAKNRNGQIGVCNLLFLKNICYFWTPSPETNKIINEYRDLGAGK